LHEGKEGNNVFFGWQISCTLTKKNLRLPDLSVTPNNGTDQEYYCISGSEKEQRGVCDFHLFPATPKK
jgi:hypothetical protein